LDFVRSFRLLDLLLASSSRAERWERRISRDSIAEEGGGKARRWHGECSRAARLLEARSPSARRPGLCPSREELDGLLE